MPHSLDRGAPQNHNSNKTRNEIDKSHREDKARDNLAGDYAGAENRGPAKHPKEDHVHSTNVKKRGQRKEQTLKV